MSDYKYIIVGGGMTADSAVAGIREHDADGSIAVFSKESDPPYNRPPLSKALWKGEQLDTIWRKTDQRGIDFFAHTRVTAVNPANKSVRSADGKTITYDKLLLATGGTPRRLPFASEDVVYFRTLEDYRKLRAVADQASDFVVIGGGFIGSEIAAALAMNGKKVTMILPESGIGAKAYPKGLSSFILNYYSEKGVSVQPEDSVVAIERKGSHFEVATKKGKKFPADSVVAGLGITPSDDLAKAAGLAVDNGIIVDAFLRTTNHDIFAAGDAANFYNASLDTRIRVEHEDNANTMGRFAGLNMSGQRNAYNHLPFFYSDLFDLGYEAVGELDSHMEIAEDWVEQYRKGVLYYLRDENIRGVLLWNTWGKVDEARKLITSKKKFFRDSVKGLIKD